MKKIDVDAILYILFLGLKKQKEKVYSDVECNYKSAYIFDNYDSFKAYFINNDVEPTMISRICDICEMKETKRGSIIALKGLCDNSISMFNRESVKERKLKRISNHKKKD